MAIREAFRFVLDSRSMILYLIVLMENDFIHQPVLLRGVLDFLDVQKDRNYVDATANGGGHLLAIAEKIGDQGHIFGFELDPDIFIRLKEKTSGFKNIQLFNESYINIHKALYEYNFKKKKIDGVLFDLGVSSWHLDQSDRGFSFRGDQILDMRFNPNSSHKTAAEIINSYPEPSLVDIFKNFGEERYALQIARAIVAARRVKHIVTSGDLVTIIMNNVPFAYKRRKIHPATKIFQALRIEVNDELKNIEIGIRSAISVLQKGGRICVISFHSLEDRIVKNLFKELYSAGSLESISKKVITASFEEKKLNPRSRSAKMRYAII